MAEEDSVMPTEQEGAERLKKTMTLLGVSAAGFADVLDCHKNTIYHIKSARNKMTLKFMLKIVREYPTVSLTYLKAGQEPALLDPKEMISQQNLLGFSTGEKTFEETVLNELATLKTLLMAVLNKK